MCGCFVVCARAVAVGLGLGAWQGFQKRRVMYAQEDTVLSQGWLLLCVARCADLTGSTGVRQQVCHLHVALQCNPDQQAPNMVLSVRQELLATALAVLRGSVCAVQQLKSLAGGGIQTQNAVLMKQNPGQHALKWLPTEEELRMCAAISSPGLVSRV